MQEIPFFGRVMTPTNQHERGTHRASEAPVTPAVNDIRSEVQHLGRRYPGAVLCTKMTSTCAPAGEVRTGAENSQTGCCWSPRPSTPDSKLQGDTMSTTDKPSTENATALLDSANAAAQKVADTAKKAAAPAGDAIEASVERIRGLNEQAIQAARSTGQRALDAYQAALESVVGAEQKLAEGSHLDWFTTLVTTQAEFTQRLGAIFLTAAREQLK